MRRLLGLLAFGVVAVAAGCSSGGGNSAGQLTVQGQTEIAGASGDWKPVTGTVQVKSDEQVRVVDGEATITLGGEGKVSLRKGTQVKLTQAPNSSIDSPTLVAGDLLVEAPRGRVVVNAGDSDVVVEAGAARLARSPSLVVGTYSGTAMVTSAGRGLQVPALHQATVVAVGLLPSQSSPLVYTTGDSWDERFLGDAIQLGDELAARSRGFTAQLRPGQDTNAGFYRQLIPALETQPDFGSTVVAPGGPAGETLVGLAITAEGSKGSFTDRLQQVFAFHEDGAAWGLVALDQGVSRVKILATVDDALGRGPSLLAAPVAPAQQVSRASPRPSAEAPAQPATAPTPSAAASPPPTTVPLPSAGPLRTGVPLVDGTVNSLVDVLSGLLGALGR